MTNSNTDTNGKPVPPGKNVPGGTDNLQKKGTKDIKNIPNKMMTGNRTIQK